MSDKIPIKMAKGDVFRIRRYNELNWVLEIFQPGQTNPFTGGMGRGKWVVYGYYGQLSDVAHHLLNQQILFSDGTSGKQIMDAIEQAKKRIIEVLEKCNDPL